jgi:hypothetical protein
MVSVIVYGRNDSYGYNLHKRAAISLNCIAEVLTEPDDEILFVDCNTPNEMPTFPEAIADTLTAKARQLIRVLRLRPDLYERYKRDSPLKVLEPLCRNTALRRSNPANRWILSTNTDMVFAPRHADMSLSDIVAGLPDGLYELPRFEIPGALWESVDRNDPRKVMSLFALWGERLHLNVAIISRPEIRFDGPGDFQLMPREQVFGIHGFNEEMTLGWHVDSNLCRRLYLLNGKTESLLEHVFAYHCDHTRQVTAMHDSAGRTENDSKRFIYNVTSPYLPGQAEIWGLPREEIEEIRLKDERGSAFSHALEELLPGMATPVASDFYLAESYDQSQIYDNFHTFPFLADYLIDMDRSSTLGYFGGNLELLALMRKFFSKIGYSGAVLVDSDLIASAPLDGSLRLPENCRVVDREKLLERSDIYVFDAGIMHLQSLVAASDTSTAIRGEEADDFRTMLADAFYQCVDHERKRSRAGGSRERQFMLIGAHHTWFEGVILECIGTTVTPYSTHVRPGFPWKNPKGSAWSRPFFRLLNRPRRPRKTGLAMHYTRQGKNYLRAGDYKKAQRYFYMAFCCRRLYVKNLRRFLLAHLWGLRGAYTFVKRRKRSFVGRRVAH